MGSLYDTEDYLTNNDIHEALINIYKDGKYNIKIRLVNEEEEL